MIADLEAPGRVLPGTSAPLGRVRTGVAVRDGDALPRIADRAQLAATLLAASAIYVPDIVRSTAGIHVASVLERLGIFDDRRRRACRCTRTARRRCARWRAASAPGAVGCTQITEIRYTPGVVLVGPLPAEFELATVYSVAVVRGGARHRARAVFRRAAFGPGYAGRCARTRDSNSY